MAGGTCTRHLGVGNAVFCSLNYGHMVTAGGVAPPLGAAAPSRRFERRPARVRASCATARPTGTVKTEPAARRLAADGPRLGRFVARPPRFERGQTGVKARRATITQGAIVNVGSRSEKRRAEDSNPYRPGGLAMVFETSAIAISASPSGSCGGQPTTWSDRRESNPHIAAWKATA